MRGPLGRPFTTDLTTWLSPAFCPLGCGSSLHIVQRNQRKAFDKLPVSPKTEAIVRMVQGHKPQWILVASKSAIVPFSGMQIGIFLGNAQQDTKQLSDEDRTRLD